MSMTLDTTNLDDNERTKLVAMIAGISIALGRPPASQGHVTKRQMTWYLPPFDDDCDWVHLAWDNDCEVILGTDGEATGGLANVIGCCVVNHTPWRYYDADDAPDENPRALPDPATVPAP